MDKMSTFSLAVVLAAFLALANAGDMMRKSIVFDKNTPDVFYCPQRKPTGFDKLIVHSRPLSKLCQFEGGPIPADYKSDCYNDVDETEYACKEKYRIMVCNPSATYFHDRLRGPLIAQNTTTGSVVRVRGCWVANLQAGIWSSPEYYLQNKGYDVTLKYLYVKQ